MTNSSLAVVVHCQVVVVLFLTISATLQQLARLLLEACIGVHDMLLRVGSSGENLLGLAVRLLLTREHLVLPSQHGRGGASLGVECELVLTWLQHRWLSVARHQIRIRCVSAVRLISDVDLLKEKQKAAINFKFQNFDNAFTKNGELTYMAI